MGLAFSAGHDEEGTTYYKCLRNLKITAAAVEKEVYSNVSIMCVCSSFAPNSVDRKIATVKPDRNPIFASN